jgi:nucleoside-diphosphate-sugar epimerase
MAWCSASNARWWRLTFGCNNKTKGCDMLLTRDTLPETIADIAALDELLCRPSQALIDDLAGVDGDVMVLGVSGKMGPTLAGLAKAALPERRIIGVARFSEDGVEDWLKMRGIETVHCDLLDEAEIRRLPQASNIIFMAGRKFGAEANLALTWAMNAHVPALVAQAFRDSRIVAFSTGCVYPFVPVDGGGADEATPPNPPGEYAQSCVGRERMFEYFSRRFNTPGRLLRLNYAIDMRYGLLHDIATKVRDGTPIAVSLGHVNFIWQGDACAQALRCLAHCQMPTSPINVSGHEIFAVRDLAAKFGDLLGRKPVTVGKEEPTAWLTNTSQAAQLFGLPVVDTERLIKWTADWVARAMPSLGKPTKYELRDGRY